MNTHTKKGIPTAYGLACGYVQKRTKDVKHDVISKELYKEHTIYHVRFILNGKCEMWNSFEKLADARKYYSSLKMVNLFA